MSDSSVAEDLVIEEPTPTRIQRNVPDRQMRDEPIDTESAVSEAQRNASDRAVGEVAAANERARLAEEGRVRAENQVAQAATTVMSQREQTLLSNEAAITQAKTGAIAALRAARETGDFDGEIAAQQTLSQATFDLSRIAHDKQQFANEKARLANQARQTPTTQQQQAQTTPEAQRWLDTHPRYYTDDEYRSDAVAAHALAIDRGISVGSQAYVNFIEGRMTKLYGDGHGQDGGNDVGRKSRLDANGQAPRRMDSSAARPGGGGGHDDRQDSLRYRHDKGEVRIIQVSDPRTGAVRDSVAGIVPAQWVEFAKINKMPVDVYAAEQIRIQTDNSLSGLHYRQNGVYK